MSKEKKLSYKNWLLIVLIAGLPLSCQQEPKLTPEQVAAKEAIDSLSAFGDRIRESNKQDSLRRDSITAVENAEAQAEAARQKELHTKAPDVVITAENWYNMYKDNEAAADRRFVDKILEVSGTVDKVVNLSGSYKCYLNAGRWSVVACEFDSEADAAGLVKGQQVTFIGRATPKSGMPEIVEARLKK